jgi:hypothetical protein
MIGGAFTSEKKSLLKMSKLDHDIGIDSFVNTSGITYYKIGITTPEGDGAWSMQYGPAVEGHNREGPY